MTRILFWNVNNFSMNKIFSNQFPGIAFDRFFYMLSVMNAINPDIIVIVEVTAPNEFAVYNGVVANNNPGTQGALQILTELRSHINPNYCLVPLLYNGIGNKRETVAVYYRQNALQFIGPYVYGNDNAIHYNRPAPFARLAGTLNYPAPFDPASNYAGAPVLNNRVTPGGFVNAGINENILAGQYEYFDATGASLAFPFANDRAPFLTSFIDLAAAVPRVIKLFSIHTSPSVAPQAVQSLLAVPEINHTAANEVSVLAGDFNVDTYNNRAAYDMFTHLGPVGLAYELVFDSVPPGGVNIDNNRQAYTCTHLLPTDESAPYNTTNYAADPNHNVYPRYGYMGAMGGYHFTVPTLRGSIDNFLVKYGAAAGGPTANKTIINPIVGSPYNAVGLNVPPANVNDLINGLPFNSTFTAAIPMPAAGVLGGCVDANPHDPNDNNLAVFRNFNNFDKIRDTSDHLPISIDV